MRHSLLAVALLAAVPAVASAQLRGADIPWNYAGALVGSRVEGIGFVAGDRYAGDGLTFNLGWNVTYDAGSSLFSYVYTLTGVGGRLNNSLQNGPGISHFILGLSQSCDADLSECVSGATRSLNGGATTALVAENGDPATYGPSAGNPGLGITFFGAKYNSSFPQSGPSGTITIAFTSEHRPMWGDFYIKGGSDSYLVNNAATAALVNSNAAGDYVAVPNSLGAMTAVPEPATVGLMATGLLAIGGVAARRRRGA